MSEVLRAVRVGTAGGRVMRQSVARGVRFPAFAGSGFHIIRQGSCWLITENEEPVALGPGDVVLTSSGAEHGLNHVPCALADLPPVVMGPFPPAPGPLAFELLCGAYRLEHGSAPGYLRALLDLIAVSPDYDRHPEPRALIDLLCADVSSARIVSGVTLPALVDLILVHVLRQWHENQHEDQHGAAAWPRTDDPAIAAALREIHQNSQEQWTVARLSQAAGMPRAAFTRRFTSGGRPTAEELPDQLADGSRCPVAQGDRRHAGHDPAPGRVLDGVRLLRGVPARVRRVAERLPPHSRCFRCSVRTTTTR